MKPLARTEDEARYWVDHVRAGAVLTLIVALVCLVYVHLTNPTTTSPATLTAAVLLGAIPAAAALAAPLADLVVKPQGTTLLYGWNALILACIAVASMFDGGWRSPLLFLLVLPPVRASIAYPPRGVLVSGVLAFGLGLAVCWLSGAPAGFTLLGSFTLVALTGSCLAAARNNLRRQRREELLGRRLRHLADHDSLTGLLARRAFLARLDEQHEAARRDGTGLCLLLADIDHFKQVNDAYGHPTGDDILRGVAGVMAAAGRQIDVTARLGGDEFALLLPGAELDAARRVALRLVDDVRTAELPTPATVSVGIACLEPEMTAEGLVARADESLYEAKVAGRDRVGQTGVGQTGQPSRRQPLSQNDHS